MHDRKAEENPLVTGLLHTLYAVISANPVQCACVRFGRTRPFPAKHPSVKDHPEHREIFSQTTYTAQATRLEISTLRVPCLCLTVRLSAGAKPLCENGRCHFLSVCKRAARPEMGVYFAVGDRTGVAGNAYDDYMAESRWVWP